jgi:hypothetical protein
MQSVFLYVIISYNLITKRRRASSHAIFSSDCERESLMKSMVVNDRQAGTDWHKMESNLIA